MAKTLKEMIAEGFVMLTPTGDNVRISKKRFDEQTGEEIQPQREEMTKEQVEYYIAMRQQQLEDLQEILKVFPKE